MIALGLSKKKNKFSIEEILSSSFIVYVYCRNSILN